MSGPKVSIVVPSRERARWLESRPRATLDFVAPMMNVTFAVRDDDSQMIDYEAYAKKRGVSLHVYPSKGILGAAQTYDRFIDVAILTREAQVLIILDDDLAFSMHNPVMGAKPDFKLCTTDELYTLLCHAAKIVSPQLPMLTFTPIMKRTQDRIVAFCKPVMMAYVFYLSHFEQHLEHRFWKGEELEARCDLNLSLQLLTNGFLTAFMCTLFIPDNVNHPGGCSVYRDLECERASVSALKALYPEYVKTYLKRGWVDDPSVVREAPRIAWKEAFNRRAFMIRFGARPEDYANKLVEWYEYKYASWVEVLRRATH